MKHSFKNRIQYKFEQFMAKGGSSIFVSLTMVFIISFILIIGLRFILMAIFNDSIDPVTQSNRNFFQDVYAIWLQMTDPGNMNQDIYSGTGAKISAIIAGLVGVILLSALIAFITTALDNLLYEFRKGRGSILENEHTLILGWNERVVDILRELIIANESEDYASVVILSSEDKEKMDDFIAKRLPDTQTTKIITSNGNSSNINELKRVSAADAKSVIIMASCSDSAVEEEKLLSDTQAIKTIMAILSCQESD
ncbi:MAG: TrkA-related ion transporter, partial [Chitinophagales bacterium]